MKGMAINLRGLVQVARFGLVVLEERQLLERLVQCGQPELRVRVEEVGRDLVFH